MSFIRAESGDYNHCIPTPNPSRREGNKILKPFLSWQGQDKNGLSGSPLPAASATCRGVEGGVG